jgi:hypothetical protein
MHDLDQAKGKMRIFDAMLWKREIGTSGSIEVKMLDTLKDGIVLTIEQQLVDSSCLEFLKEFVKKNKLNLLLDNERYFISTNALKPSSLSVWEN